MRAHGAILSGRSVFIFGASLSLLLGCAPAMPSFAGGSTVPTGRTDLATGAAYRIPVGDLSPAAVSPGEPGAELDHALSFGAPGGATPLVFVRHGLGSRADLGVEATASSARAHLRGRLPLGTASLLFGIAPHVGVAHDDTSAVRLGGTVPLVLAIDLFSLYEAWIGARITVEHIRGDLGALPVSLTGLRTGGVVGLAVGFRRFHVMMELGVDHELWTGDLGDNAIDANGLVLTPAFAVRLRL